MPTVSLFYGILIQIFPSDYNPPHFYAKYQGYSASFDFDGNLKEGKFPANKQKLVSAWAVLHKEDLEANWELACAGLSCMKIEPLR